VQHDERIFTTTTTFFHQSNPLLLPPQEKKKKHNPETPTPIYNPFPLSPVCFPGKFEQKKHTHKIFLGNQLLIEWKGKKWRQRETRVG
jgi:hypothetical protein